MLVLLLRCFVVRIPFEAPECDRYDEYKHQLIDYGLKLLQLSRDSSVIFEFHSQESIMSIVGLRCRLSYYMDISLYRAVKMLLSVAKIRLHVIFMGMSLLIIIRTRYKITL